MNSVLCDTRSCTIVPGSFITTHVYLSLWSRVLLHNDEWQVKTILEQKHGLHPGCPMIVIAMDDPTPIPYVSAFVVTPQQNGWVVIMSDFSIDCMP